MRERGREESWEEEKEEEEKVMDDQLNVWWGERLYLLHQGDTGQSEDF